MNHNLNYYPAQFKMRSLDPSSLRIIDIWTFKSTKSNKRYIAEVEHFSDNFLGIKFFWKGVASSKNRYSLMTNDNEPRTIVMSCIMIMREYLISDDKYSFGFVAAPDINKNNEIVVSSRPNKRFRFYRRMMLSLFGPDTFIQAYDLTNSLYLLINKKSLAKGEITIHGLEDKISQLYEGEYNITLHPSQM